MLHLHGCSSERERERERERARERERERERNRGKERERESERAHERVREGESDSKIEREIACMRGDLRKRVGVRGHLRVEYSSVNGMDAPVCVCVTLYRNVCVQTLACRLLARVRCSEKWREPAHPTKLEVLYWALREIAREKKSIHTQETERHKHKERESEREGESEKIK